MKNPMLRRGPGLHLLAVVHVVAGNACDPAAREDHVPDVVVRDSAGLEIVENHAPVWDASDFWTVDPEPEFVIGAAGDSSHLVWGALGAAPLSDGRVVMITPDGSRKVVIFERSGAVSASFGRYGEGPGDLRYPLHLRVLPGDTIVVWDQMFGRINHYDPFGNLLAEPRIDAGRLIEATSQGDQHPHESVYSPLPDGSFLLKLARPGWQRPTDPGEIYRRPEGYVRIDSSWEVHSFGWWDGEEYSSMSSPWDLGILPYAARSMAVGGGRQLTIYLSNGDRYEVHQFSATGDLRRILRRTAAPIPVSDEELEEWIATFKGLNPGDWSRWEREIKGLTGRRHPPIRSLRLDAAGYLWVGDGGNREGSEWSIFDPEGRWLGTLSLPITGLYWIGEDLILGGRADYDAGIQTVEGYRLNRRG